MRKERSDLEQHLAQLKQQKTAKKLYNIEDDTGVNCTFLV